MLGRQQSRKAYQRLQSFEVCISIFSPVDSARNRGSSGCHASSASRVRLSMSQAAASFAQSSASSVSVFPRISSIRWNFTRPTCKIPRISFLLLYAATASGRFFRAGLSSLTHIACDLSSRIAEISSHEYLRFIGSAKNFIRHIRIS